MRHVKHREPSIALLLVACILPSAARGQFSVAPRFNLSDVVRVDEVDHQVLAELGRVDELIAAGQIDDGLEALGRVSAQHGRKLYRVEPGRFIPLSDYVHARTASLPAEALALYRRRVDPAAEAAYRAGIAERDERALESVVDRYFASGWGDDAVFALGELALERGDYTAARRAWLALFESPPAAVASEVFERTISDTGLPKADRALVERFYAAHVEPPREKPMIVEPPGEAPAPTEPAKPPQRWHVANAAAWQTMTDADAANLVRIWRSRGLPASRLAYPAASVPLADVRARLILVDVLTGGIDEAAEKLASFRRLHPTTRGMLGGQERVLHERLAAIVEEAKSWPKPAAPADWPTFAGGTSREAITTEPLPSPLALGDPVWRVSLGKPVAAHIETDRQVLQRQPRVGESWDGILGYHPVIIGEHLFVAYGAGIAAFDVKTGRPAWPADGPAPPANDDANAAAKRDDPPSADAALIYRDEDFAPLKTNQWVRGVPRFTLNAQGNWLLARVGPPATSRPTESRIAPATAPSKLVVLDVSTAGQGKLVCDPIEPDDEKLAFDGAPLADGRFVFAVMRRSDVRPEALVACYDLDVSPPKLRWRTSIAAAETPGSGQLFECTHNLLSRDGDTLYLNTNLGAVAALDAADGKIRWLHAYPRVKLGDLRRLADTGHFYRDLTPCLLHRDLAIVAPFDSPAIFALDAATGTVRWTTDAAPDAIHLLGAVGNTLWASGDRLYAIDARTGGPLGLAPEAVRPIPRGAGRGLIVGDAVLWPTRDELYVFDARVKEPGKPLVQRQPPIQWSRRGVTGGNLIWRQGRLIVAGDDEMVAFAVSPAVAPNKTTENR